MSSAGFLLLWCFSKRKSSSLNHSTVKRSYHYHQVVVILLKFDVQILKVSNHNYLCFRDRPIWTVCWLGTVEDFIRQWKGNGLQLAGHRPAGEDPLRGGGCVNHLDYKVNLNCRWLHLQIMGTLSSIVSWYMFFFLGRTTQANSCRCQYN